MIARQHFVRSLNLPRLMVFWKAGQTGNQQSQGTLLSSVFLSLWGLKAGITYLLGSSSSRRRCRRGVVETAVAVSVAVVAAVVAVGVAAQLRQLQ